MLALSTALRAAAALSVAACIALGAAAPQPVVAQRAVESPCDIRTTERVVAIGDVHGAYENLVAILRAAGLIDRRDRWSGGRARLVQTGDILDRGADSRKVIDFFRRLERDAANAGGRVYTLLGNHEFMRLVGDWRYVSPGEFRAFQNADSEDFRERAFELISKQNEERARAEQRPFDRRLFRDQFMKEIPLGYLEMRLAFDNGDYGKWVKSRPTAVKINGVLFLHGGISEKVAELGCAGVNAAVAADIASLPVPASQVASLLSSTEDGPLWYRGLAQEPEETFTPTLDAILARTGARAVVIGHTPVSGGKIQTRFGGRVLLIDTGMRCPVRARAEQRDAHRDLRGPARAAGRPRAVRLELSPRQTCAATTVPVVAAGMAARRRLRTSLNTPCIRSR
jgi:hypothetical protein